MDNTGMSSNLGEISDKLESASDQATIQEVVRSAARSLARSHGSTLVLREGDRCFYADEDAMSPLWKGQRFPITQCISGWAMLHGTPAVVPDVYKDERIPIEAYRPTFVKSLAIVPVGDQPIGAIGAYWAMRHTATPDELAALQELGDLTAAALDRVMATH